MKTTRDVRMTAYLIGFGIACFVLGLHVAGLVGSAGTVLGLLTAIITVAIFLFGYFTEKDKNEG